MTQQLDPTYDDLPHVGEKDPAKLRVLASLTHRLGLASGVRRAAYIGSSSERINASQNLYLYGREDYEPNDQRPTVNLIQGAINTFDADSNRVPASMNLKSMSANEDGPWVLIKPYTFHAPRDQQGNPQINPNTGQPYQDIDLQLYEPIPEEVVDHVPENRRYLVNTENVVKWQQINFDVVRRDVDLDQVIRDMIHAKQIIGWPMILFGWDSVSERPEFDMYPPQQWFPDPIKAHVHKMNYVRLDLPCDANEAKRKFPAAHELIDKYASRAVPQAPGAFGYSDLYVGGTKFETPMVVLVITFLRNQIAPMTLEEATQTGFAKVENATTAQEAPEAQGGKADTSDEDGEQEGGETDDGGVDENPGGKSRVTHAHLPDVDLSESFGADGSPNLDSLHEHHPMKVVTVQWVTIRDEVVPGSYMVCPHWDIPVILDKNVQILGVPFAQPETERLRSIQRGINITQESMENHAEWFKGPAGIMSAELAERVDPDLKNGFAKPGKIYTVDMATGGSEFDIRRHFVELAPPTMPAALPEVNRDLMDKFEKVANQPGVRQGTPPAGVTSGVAIRELTEQSAGASDAKSQYSEIAIRRMLMLTNHALVHWMSTEEIMRINRSAPQPVVERYIRPFAQSIMWDGEVSLATGAGAVKARRDQQIRADFGAGLIDRNTALQASGDYDEDEVERNFKKQVEDEARAQAEAQAATQPPASENNGPKMNITINFADLPKDVQMQVEEALGFAPSQQPMTVDQMHDNLKIQNEAARTIQQGHAAREKAEKDTQPEPVVAE